MYVYIYIYVYYTYVYVYIYIYKYMEPLGKSRHFWAEKFGLCLEADRLQAAIFLMHCNGARTSGLFKGLRLRLRV